MPQGECYPAPSSVSLFARHLLPYWRRLLLSCSLIALDRSCPLSQSATPDSRTQPCPRGSGQRSWTPGRAQHDRRGKMKSCLGGACSYPGNLSFSLPRGAGGQGHSQFYSSSFHVTYRFFVTFFTEESNVPLRSLRPPASLLFAIKKAKLLLRRNIAIRVSLFHPEAGLAAVH